MTRGTLTSKTRAFICLKKSASCSDGHLAITRKTSSISAHDARFYRAKSPRTLCAIWPEKSRENRAQIHLNSDEIKPIKERG